MTTSYVLKVSANGQVSIPAEAHSRWQPDRVAVGTVVGLIGTWATADDIAAAHPYITRADHHPARWSRSTPPGIG